MKSRLRKLLTQRRNTKEGQRSPRIYSEPAKFKMQKMQKLKAKRIPFRMCAGCKKRYNPKELLRLAKSHEGVVFDSGKSLLGRGVWICPDDKCLEMAFKNRAIERSLKIKFSEDNKEELIKSLASIIRQ